ncbi:MAG: hypothetical protein D6816_09670 [Bacteroidetes bacterium]|nr:MAG: hypothetical protein D6816_09670 [Bacteroidota bacterium]
MTIQIFPFGEGKTEKIIFEMLRSQVGSPPDVEFQKFVSVNGKGNFSKRISNTISSILVSSHDIRVVIFRDLDHGETPENVVQAFQGIAWNLLAKWNLTPPIQPVNGTPNIYVLNQPVTSQSPGFRLVLHLPDNGIFNNLPVPLHNRTTDGYVLTLGLDDTVLNRFAKKLGTQHNILHNLITTSIPQTVTGQGITFDQDKDFLAAYLCATRFWPVHRTEEQAKLVEIIMKRAEKYNSTRLRQVFKSWLDAIQEVVR